MSFAQTRTFPAAGVSRKPLHASTDVNTDLRIWSNQKVA